MPNKVRTDNVNKIKREGVGIADSMTKRRFNSLHKIKLDQEFG